MILITHSLVGAAIARRLPQPILVFLVGVLTHYIFDRIPHWHYSVPRVRKASLAPPGEKSFSFSRATLPDVTKVIFDLLIGLGLSLLLFDSAPLSIFLASFGACLPDLLVGIAKIWPTPVLAWHDKFHRWNHTLIRLDDRPVLGIGSQVAIVLFFILVFG